MVDIATTLFLKDQYNRMNNKKIGNDFEKEMVERLRNDGYWVHFISPNVSGAQPFDLIFAKDGKVCVADCKTSQDNIFRISRLEWNQILSFNKWMDCGNDEPVIFVKYKDDVKIIPYSILKLSGKVRLDDF